MEDQNPQPESARFPDPGERDTLLRQAFILDSIMDAIVFVGNDERIEEWNHGAELLFGYTREEALGRSPSMLRDPETTEQTGREIREGIEREGRWQGEVDVIRKDGSRVLVETIVIPLRDSAGRITGRVGVNRDVTARKQAEQSIARRDAIMESVSYAAQRLLRDSVSDSAINGILGHLGQATGVSRAYLFENTATPDGLAMRQTHEWTAPGISKQIDNPNLRDYPYSPSYVRWEHQLSSGRPVHGTVSSMPELERTILVSQEICSLAIVPLFVASKWHGFLGLDDCWTERVWSPPEIDALQVAADLLGAALRRDTMDGALRASETRNRALLDAIPDTLFLLDRNGHATDYRAARPRTGLDEIAFVPGADLSAILPYEFAKKILSRALIVHEKGGSEVFEHHVALPPSPPGDYEVRIVPCGADHVLVILRNISQRKTAERSLKASEERYRRAIAQADGVLYQKDIINNVYTYIGDGIEKLTGYRASEMSGSLLHEIMEEEVFLGPIAGLDRGEARARILSGQIREWRADYRIRSRTGEVRWLSDSAVLFYDENNRLSSSLGVLLDVTARKAAEMALRHSDERYRQAIAQADAVLYERDYLGRRFSYMGPGIYELTGYTAEEMTASLLDSLIVERVLRGDAEGMEIGDAVTKAKRGELVFWKADYLIRTRSGELRWLADSSIQLYDESANSVGSLGILQDISERKFAELRLRAFAQLTTRLAAARSVDEIATVVREESRELLGWDSFYLAARPVGAEDFRSLTFADTTGDRLEVQGASSRNFKLTPLTARAVRGESVLLNRTAEELAEPPEHGFGDMARRSASMMVVPVFSADFLVGFLSAQSYTLRRYGPGDLRMLEQVAAAVAPALKRAFSEEALRISEERYRFLYDDNPMTCLTVSQDGVILSVNSFGARLLGYEALQLAGRPVFDLTPEEDHNALQEHLRSCLLNERGTTTWEIRKRRSDGELIWVRETARLARSEFGGKVILSVCEDLTERKKAEAERERFNSQLQHTQKLESLGILAGGIAHDFNNLLAGILGNAGLALQDLLPGTSAHEAVAQIELASVRAADLTRQMLAYSGKGRFVVEVFDANEMVREMANLLRSSTSRTARIDYRLSPDPVFIEADATQIRQVVMNLITNASEAIGGAPGAITLETGYTVVGDGPLGEGFAAERMEPGEHAFIRVSDTGTGMTPEVQARIFDPFFSTKFTGRGLGLAAVLGIVRSHRGGLKVQSRAGEGSVFTVLFPRAYAVDATPRPVDAPMPNSPATPTGRILVVDDEETLLNLTRRTLERAGYEVVTAENGVVALEKFRARPRAFLLVLLDLTMPELSGDETLQRLTAIDPNVRVVFMSGYSQQEIHGRVGASTFAGFIQKPFKPQALVELVASVLARTPEPRSQTDSL